MLLADAQQRAHHGGGAVLLGILDGVLEDALDYVKERQAFGKPIGEFQILQHYIADIAMWRSRPS